MEEDFRALADGHTKAITTLRAEFNDDQMVFRLEAEKLWVLPLKPNMRPLVAKMMLPLCQHYPNHTRM